MPEQIPAAFISYCRDDQEFALRLAQDLKDAGAAVWLDQLDIKPGHPWDNAVEVALRAATKMLVILTPTSVASENVRDEIAYALKQGKIVIPVLYMECEIPLRLERKQHIDFRANYARGLDLLLRELRVDHPNQAVLEKAAEGDAQRQLAWQAREAAIQQTEADRVEQINSARAARTISTGHSERSEESQYLPPAPAVHSPAAADRSNKSIHPALWIAGGIAAILILGFFFLHKSPSSHLDTASKPSPVDAKPTPQAAIPQPTPTALQPSPSSFSRTIATPSSTHDRTPIKAEVVPGTPASTPKQGNTTVKHTVANPSASSLYQQGYSDFIRQDYSDAATLFEQACNLGEGRSCTNLGALYALGNGVEKDLAKAAVLYQKGCDGGYSGGCKGLGERYEMGDGVGRDVGKAKEFFQRACHLGDSDSCSEVNWLNSR